MRLADASGRRRLLSPCRIETMVLAAMAETPRTRVGSSWAEHVALRWEDSFRLLRQVTPAYALMAAIPNEIGRGKRHEGAVSGFILDCVVLAGGCDSDGPCPGARRRR